MTGASLVQWFSASGRQEQNSERLKARSQCFAQSIRCTTHRCRQAQYLPQGGRKEDEECYTGHASNYVATGPSQGVLKRQAQWRSCDALRRHGFECQGGVGCAARCQRLRS